MDNQQLELRQKINISDYKSKIKFKQSMNI
jgi:hypothetical protein